ncbi:MAG: phenolic acid decarboxylase [Acidobacteria bacterium]|nr:MAG: phenolic acid decarboxylase [Acidobacteriota bacterium]
MKLIVGITGATGTIFGVRLLQVLKDAGVESHLVLSKWGARTLVAYPDSDQGAVISSGSFVTDGMIVAPCSMRTLAAIAHGQGDNLIHRAADVILKERRKLVLLVREAPFSDIHLENMLKLSRMGVVITPPAPAFYNHPQTLDDMINHIVMRTLDQFGMHLDASTRWDGMMTTGGTPQRNSGTDV